MMRTARSNDAAIVGMACLLPGAIDAATYWRNIVGKGDAIGDPPVGSDADLAFDPATDDNDRIYCKRGGYLGEAARFDPLRYGVMPSSIDGGEPDQYLALRVAYEAMEDAGYLVRDFDHDRAEVVIGRGTYINRGFTNVVLHGLAVNQALALLRRLHPEHSEAELALLKRELKAQLPPFNADMAPGLVPNVMSGRIANRLDLRGPNFTIDAACASSLVAVDRAMQDLREERCDLALVGGVHCSTPAPILMIFCQLGALSRSGTMRPFDRRADGTLLGEGAGFIVMRRLADAERDGDRIYAVIRGVGTASDGRGMGMLAPRVEGEALALRRAYDAADVPPRTVGLIEAHGTATPVGDATEIAALSQVFGELNGEPPWCAIGCVKSMISHLIPAAGIAGIIKVALSLHHKVLPPTLHCEEPNPALGLERTPLYLNTEARPWVHGADVPRRAGVNAFGFGGINAHAVLEEYGESDRTVATCDPLDWDVEVLVLGAQSREELLGRARETRRFLARGGDIRLRDVACTVSRWLTDDATERLALVAASAEEAGTRLDVAIERLSDPQCSRLRDAGGLFYDSRLLGAEHGSVAFLFPGEGSQYPGMLADLCLHFPEARECFDAVDRTFAGYRDGPPTSTYVFPPPGCNDQALGERLFRMDGAGESLFAASQAVLAVLVALGIGAHAALGHSSGEYGALLASGAVAFPDEADLAASTRAINAVYEAAERDGAIARARLVAVASVAADLVAATVDAAPGDVFIAMDNCPHQTVLCGTDEAISWTTERLREAGGICTELPFDRPYHTPWFAAFAGALEGHLATLPFAAPRLALWSCATAERFPDEPDEVRRVAVAQWSKPVRFRETVEAMHQDGVRVFIECGPRANLTAFVDDTLRRRPHLAVAADVEGQPGLRQLATCLAQLAVHGVPIDFAGLYARRGAGVVDLGAAPPGAVKRAPRLEMAMPALHLDRIPAELASTTRPPADVLLEPVASSESVADAIIETHFGTMQRLIDAHRSVTEALIRDGSAAAAESTAMPPWRPDRTGIPVPAPAAVDSLPAAELPVPNTQATSSAEDSSELARPGDRIAVEDSLRALISERTGYPPAAIASDLNLEADLGVDSIKRVEILETYRACTAGISGLDLDRLAKLRTLQELAEAIVSAAAGGGPAATGPDASAAPKPPAPDPGPLLTTIDELTPGSSGTVTCELDLGEHLFLRDHTLEGAAVSTGDETLIGLPVMPLTFSMELLAEVASLIRPGDRVTGMRDVRATRWITVPTERLTLELVGRAENDHDVRVELYERASGQAPVVTAMVELSESPAEPTGARLELDAPTASHWNERPLYGGTSMFHGPAFQAVRSIDKVGAAGIEATLIAPPADMLLRSRAAPAFLIEPVLLDAMGQVVAYWVADQHDRAINVFPFRLEQLCASGATPDQGVALRCRVRVRHIDEHGLRSDLELVGPDDRVVAAMTGWADTRMDLPQIVREFLASPRDAVLSRPWDAVAADGMTASAESRVSIVDGLSVDLLEAQGGLWLEILAHAVLSRAERARWRELRNAPGKRRRDWLRGRIAAKDAMRRLVADQEGLKVCPADIEIIVDNGSPRAVVSATGSSLSISISHAAEVAVAVAAVAGAETDAGPGIDIEPAGPLEPAVLQVAFSEAEHEVLSALSGSSEWQTRLWCAKEAALKARGTGLDGDPRKIAAITRADSSSGAVEIEVAGSARTPVKTGVADGLAFAACLLTPPREEQA